MQGLYMGIQGSTGRNPLGQAGLNLHGHVSTHACQDVACDQHRRLTHAVVRLRARTQSCGAPGSWHAYVR